VHIIHFLASAIPISVLICLFYTAIRRSARLRYIQHYTFHPVIKQKLKKKHPHFTDTQLDLAFEGLRDYFYICHQAQHRGVAMPSQLVDDVWHEFILFTRSYQLFCQKALGHFLHHTPAEAMATATHAQDGIKRAWRLACEKENINPQAPSTLPRLFSIDAQLGLANGFVYSLHCRPDDNQYCVTNIGCGGGCSSGSDSSGCNGDGGCSGGCGGGGD
jgi:hypothetical protein